MPKAALEACPMLPRHRNRRYAERYSGSGTWI